MGSTFDYMGFRDLDTKFLMRARAAMERARARCTMPSNTAMLILFLEQSGFRPIESIELVPNVVHFRHPRAATLPMQARILVLNSSWSRHLPLWNVTTTQSHTACHIPAARQWCLRICLEDVNNLKLLHGAPAR